MIRPIRLAVITPLAILSALVMLAAASSVFAKPPSKPAAKAGAATEEIIALVREHVPKASRELMTTRYAWSHVKSIFPDASVDVSTGSASVGDEQLFWELDHEKKAISFMIRFDPGKNVKSERAVMKRYEKQITPKAFENAGVGRSLTILEGEIELRFVLPVDESKAAVLRDVTFRLP